MNKDKHLQCVLESHHLNKLGKVKDNYVKKKNDVKEALSKKFSDKKTTSPIDSGSYAKKTEINTKFDMDVCIPFKKDSFSTLKEMYDEVYTYFKKEYEDNDLISVKKQKVSIGLEFSIEREILEMDIVPGREINDYSKDEELNLYVFSGLWSQTERDENKERIKTNIKEHIRLVGGQENENQRKIIKLLKVWKKENSSSSANMKSFLIELFTIEAFKNNEKNIPNGLWDKLKMTIDFIIEKIETIKLQDPANTSNIVTDTLDDNQKKNIKRNLENLLKQIEQDDENIKIYFPVNSEYPCSDGYAGYTGGRKSYNQFS